ncbi:SRPBCC domain-containing protein [Blastococcus sp. SYSU D00669]
MRPIVRQVTVAAPPERAFALFTERIGEWWPRAGHSVFGERATVAFEGRGLVERAGDRVSVWAEATLWEPPDALELDWHPGRTAEDATHVRVTFEADGERTLVTLEHSGWERRADAADVRESYEQGWPVVLGRFAAMEAPVG